MTKTSPATADLTLAEKVSLASGASFWKTEAVGAIPAIHLTDGPHGLRMQADGGDHLGLGGSLPATCFPPAAGLSQAWSTALAGRIGEALGREAQAAGVSVLLGPGVNLKRDPRAGRNFEYFSEDPILSGALGAAWVTGLQAQGVGASVKHFVANESEDDRMRSSSEIDERTLRELYLRPFQRVVEDARPWTVMCSYNRINGVYAAENHWLLTRLLRDEWGFDGVVVSDWGAVDDKVAAVEAGLDLEMPGNGGASDALALAAAEDGRLSLAAVDRAANAVAELALRARAARREVTVDHEAHHALAREAASQSIALLKNEDGILPLARERRIAVIGEFAEQPRYQGGGSSHVNPTRVDVPLEELRTRFDRVEFARGFTTDDSLDAAALRAEAVATAARAEVVVLFLGLGARQESEGFDRDTIELPADQRELLDVLAATGTPIVVVLSHGGVVRLAPVAGTARAILAAALLGQGGGAAIADVLVGAANPSGKLTETVPERIEDVPAYLNFPSENSRILYGEGLHIGHRWYDARDLAVTYPFGHGLSYTTFAYSGLELAACDDGITAAVRVTNTGTRAGREIVQFYVGKPDSAVRRPVRELKGFTDVTLQPGESVTATVLLRRADLAYWDLRNGAWTLETGEYEVHAAASSRDIRLSGSVAVVGDERPLIVSRSTTLGEIMADPAAAETILPLLAAGTGGVDAAAGDTLGMDMMRMLASIPLARVAQFGGDGGLSALLDGTAAEH
ncbi:glycoside hydrolase family 3 C-terminal domain-containing protein [Microbacterium sp. X-17]|uniref:glycoside hydrolase family 3 C-terminal domain-containing protein n=1 Tax=Microbacterium sp. X-17 TaxID=3144404 RepID=UPI0031F58111